MYVDKVQTAKLKITSQSARALEDILATLSDHAENLHVKIFANQIHVEKELNVSLAAIDLDQIGLSVLAHPEPEAIRYENVAKASASTMTNVEMSELAITSVA